MTNTNWPPSDLHLAIIETESLKFLELEAVKEEMQREMQEGKNAERDER